MINIKTDSRKVKKGDTFIAIKGNTVDGHDYIEKAIDIVIQIERLSDVMTLKDLLFLILWFKKKNILLIIIRILLINLIL